MFSHCRAANRKNTLIDKLICVYARPLTPPHANANIDVRIIRVDQRRRRIDADTNVRMLLIEVLQSPDEPFPRKYRRRRNREGVFLGINDPLVGFGQLALRP